VAVVVLLSNLPDQLQGFNIKATADDMELTENMMVHNISMFFFAGLDTTSNSFLFALAELAKNPRVLKKAQDEVDRLFDELLASGEELDFNSQYETAVCCPFFFLINLTNRNKLQYIDQIFKESLRLYTVAPGAPRVVCREDLVLGPYVLPKGCIMLMNAAGIHRQPQHWERPDEFYPEHFDEAAVASRYYIKRVSLANINFFFNKTAIRTPLSPLGAVRAHASASSSRRWSSVSSWPTLSATLTLKSTPATRSGYPF